VSCGLFSSFAWLCCYRSYRRPPVAPHRRSRPLGHDSLSFPSPHCRASLPPSAHRVMPCCCSPARSASPRLTVILSSCSHVSQSFPTCSTSPRRHPLQVQSRLTTIPRSPTAPRCHIPCCVAAKKGAAPAIVLRADKERCRGGRDAEEGAMPATSCEAGRGGGGRKE